MSDEKLYTTGEFAQLCGVKKQTLFHYDDIDLLKPSMVQDNGYRLYSAEQYQDFMLISCLKEAGMSLAEVKDYLRETDLEKKHNAMRMRIAALDQRISYLINIRKILSSSFATTGAVIGNKEGNDDMIKLETRPERQFWCIGPLDEMSDQELVECTAKLVKTVEPYGICLLATDVQKGMLDDQKYILISKEKSLSPSTVQDLGLKPFIRPAGRYCITKQQTGETADEAYGRLLSSLSSFNESPGEFFYEEYPTAGNEIDDAPFHISVQLVPNDPADGLWH